MRTSFVLHRELGRSMPMAVDGEGPYIIDADGRRYLDGSGGPGVSCLGHSHEAVIEAMHGQARRLPFAWTGFFTNEPMEALAELLASRMPSGSAKVCFTSSGSEATEAALKLARQFHVESGAAGRDQFIARRGSYHGNTLGALGVSGHPQRRARYEAMVATARFVAPCYPYRGQRDGETDSEYVERLASELEAAIVELGAERVAAFIAEPIVGATTGVVPATEGYFQAVRAVCDRYGVLLILDEVMCGMGRAGTMYAFEQEGVTPDIVTVAKGLGGGYAPLGAMIVSDRIVRTLAGGSGKIGHGQTYMGHAVACAAGLAVMSAILEENLLENVGRMGDGLEARLRSAFTNHPHVGEIRGRGLLWALELVADRTTRKTFDPERRLHVAVREEAFAGGLLCYPGGGALDGGGGDHVVLAPPYNIEEIHLDELVDKLTLALTRALSRARG